MTKAMELHVRGSELPLFKGNLRHLRVEEVALDALSTHIGLFVRGSTFDASANNTFYPLICSLSQNSPANTELKTFVCSPQGSLKSTGSFYTHQTPKQDWAAWTDWISTRTVAGDIVAVSTVGALNQEFLSGIWETLTLSFNRIFKDPRIDGAAKTAEEAVAQAMIWNLQNPDYQSWLSDKGISLEIVDRSVRLETFAESAVEAVEPAVTTAKLTATRSDAEKFAAVGNTLGQGYANDPPTDLPGEPLSSLISQHRLPQYDLMLRLLGAIKDNKLSLDSGLLGEFGELGSLVGDIVNVLVTVSNPKVEFVKGKPGMLGAPGMETVEPDKDGNNLATPENHSVRLTGDAELIGLAAKFTADFFQYKNRPHGSFKFAFDKPLGLSNFMPEVPLVSGMEISGPAIVACSAKTLYDPGFDSGINVGINFFGNIEVAESRDKSIRFLGELLQIKRFAVHAAIDTSSTPPAYIFEGAVQRDVTLLDGGSFVVRFTRADISIAVKGRPPEPEIGLSMDLVVTLREGTKETHLVFTGGIKVEPESISGAFTMNGTGRSPQGALSGSIQNTGEWKEPFGIPGITIRQMAVQMGCTYLAPWIDNIGIHGNLKIGDVDGSISILVDTNDPDQFVLAGSTERITLIQLLSASSPLTFAAYQAIPDDVKKVINNVVDVALENVKVNIVPTACSIGGVHFRDEGFTVMGRLSLWGWKASACVNVDTYDGITVSGDMDPINFLDVFKVTGAQGDPAPKLRFRLGPHEAPELYISAKLYLLGISKELKVTADNGGFTFFLRDQYGDILTTQLECQYADYNFRAKGSIDFRLNVKLDTFLGTIPLIDIGFGAGAELRVGKTDGFYAALWGSFSLWGSTVTMPKLTINITPSDFQDMFYSVLNWMKEKAQEIFGVVWKTLKEWASAVKDGVIWFAGEIADVAKQVWGATADAAVAVYKFLDKTVTDIARGLKAAFEYTAEKVAEFLKDAGHFIAEVGEAIKSVFNAAGNALKSVLEYAGYALKEIEEFFESIGEFLYEGAKMVFCPFLEPVRHRALT